VKVVKFTVLTGDTFKRRLEFKDSLGDPLDLTGDTIRGQIRATAESTTVIETFNVTIQAPATAGIAFIELTALETAAIAPGSYVFDLKFDNPDTDTILKGQLIVEQSVTR
jgi:hypothetical protein